MTTLYTTTGEAVPAYRTDGALAWGMPEPPAPDPDLTVRRHITADVWKTGRANQARVPNAPVTYMTAHRVHAHGQSITLTYGGHLPDGVTMDCAAAVEVEGRGSRVVATWGGSPSATLTGTTQQTTDPLALTVGPGDVLRVFTYHSQRSDGLNHPASSSTWYSNEILDGNQVATGQPLTAGSGYQGAGGYRAVMPHAITAMTSEGQISVALLGDSQMESGSPGNAPLPVGRQSAARTWAQRLDTEVPVANYSHWGTGYPVSWKEGVFAPIPDLSLFTHAICAWGSNNFSNASASLAAAKERAAQVWGWIAAECSNVYQTTLLPQSDSVDGWATVEGQTPRANHALRVQFNEWLRDGAELPTGERIGDVGHPLAGVIDISDYASTSRDSGVFRVDSGPMTVDGAHMSDVGHGLVSQAAGDWLATL